MLTPLVCQLDLRYLQYDEKFAPLKVTWAGSNSDTESMVRCRQNARGSCASQYTLLGACNDLSSLESS